MSTKRLLAAVVLLGAVLFTRPADAAHNCSFEIDGPVMTLQADCTTDETIVIPDGVTLHGRGHTITAMDPPGGHFLGAVVRNGGATARVLHLRVTTAGLANVCDPPTPDTRLRGILFEGASGTIAHSVVTGINQGASGCQEGNAIEVRNAPFDGTHPGTQQVTIADNHVSDWQKTGIIANGDVVVAIRNNQIGPSATQANLAANGIQLGFGARGTVENNNIAGSSWCGPSNFVATAILLFLANDSEITRNNIRGNSDVGIYGLADGLVVVNNRVFDEGTDCNTFGHDYGIGNWGDGNVFVNNKVRGFDVPYDGVINGNNKTIVAPE